MKQVLLFLCCALSLTAASAFAEAKSQIVSLPPGGKKRISFPASVSTRVGYTNKAPLDVIMNCRKNCIRMRVIGSPNPKHDTANSMGTSMQVPPFDGKIEVEFENLEQFLIKVAIFHD